MLAYQVVFPDPQLHSPPSASLKSLDSFHPIISIMLFHRGNWIDVSQLDLTAILHRVHSGFCLWKLARQPI